MILPWYLLGLTLFDMRTQDTATLVPPRFFQKILSPAAACPAIGGRGGEVRAGGGYSRRTKKLSIRQSGTTGATLVAAPDKKTRKMATLWQHLPPYRTKKHEKRLPFGNTCRRAGQKTQKNDYPLATLAQPRGRFCSNPHKY